MHLAMLGQDKDRRRLIGLVSVVVLLIVAGCIWAPRTRDDDPDPTTYNSGSAGAKAAYILLDSLGYKVARWEQPAASLASVDAAHTTLILANPSDTSEKKPADDIARFVRCGGRVVVTGLSGGRLLPDAHTGESHRLYQQLCLTSPEGRGPIAQAGELETNVEGRWTVTDGTARVQQWCGQEAVVVAYPYGQGQIVWWTSAMPLTTRGLKNDADLKLLLASVGGRDRQILFDEYVHGIQERVGLWATTRGTPVKSIAFQVAAVALLLVLSFGRRSGPVRDRIIEPRTSPIEFAMSMGSLYERAHATPVAIAVARQRLLVFLENEGGIPRDVTRSSPAAIAAAVAARFGTDTAGLEHELAAAVEAEHTPLRGRSALALVNALAAHIQRLREIIAAPARPIRMTHAQK